MVIFVPGTEETDPKKQNMSLQQLGSATSALQTSNTTNTANIAALMATGLPNTLNLGGTQFGELTYQYGTSGAPATSGTADVNVASRFGVLSAALDFGVYGSGVAWFQNRLQANLASNLAIALNPNGGGVAIGKNSAATALDVNGTATATAFSGPTSGITSGAGASAGQVGEVVLSSGSLSLTTSAVTFLLGSVALSAGDWDVSASTDFVASGTTNVTDWYASLATSSGSLTPLAGTVAQHVRVPSTADYSFGFSIPPVQVLPTGSTSYYLNARWVGSGSAPTANFVLRARRMR